MTQGSKDTAGQEPVNDELIDLTASKDADVVIDDSSDATAHDGGAVSPGDDTSDGEVLDGHFSDDDGKLSVEGNDLHSGDQPTSDEAAGVADEGSELSTLQKQLLEAESKAADYWDRLLRLQAEMENQRKRAQNDVAKARKFALEGIVGDLLPVKDSLELGLAAAAAEDADPSALVEGSELTVKMLSQVFEKNNIVEVNPVDEKFDPEFHQAMSMQEIEGKPANIVTGVMQKGYTLNERLVRPALVMVSK